MIPFSEYPIHRVNPFLLNPTSTLQLERKSGKVIKIAITDIDLEELQMLCSGRTVPKNKFVKFFIGNDEIKLTHLRVDDNTKQSFDKVLNSSTSTKTIWLYITMNLRHDSDRINLRIKNFKDIQGINASNYYEGIRNLIDWGLIAKTDVNGIYFINIFILFNGNEMLCYLRFRKNIKPQPIKC